MVRVLFTVEPRMYRQALALAVGQRRPDAEVMAVPADGVDGQVAGFDPHVLVRNDSDDKIPEELLGGVVCRVEVLFTDGMAAVISMRGEIRRVEDAGLEDLLGAVDEAEALAGG